jgi:hypothetical protein
MAKKSLYTRALGRAVARFIPTHRGSFHVLYSNKRWKVVRVGNVRPTKSFSKQQDAIKYATALTKKDSDVIFVHNESGQLNKKLSVGL